MSCRSSGHHRGLSLLKWVGQKAAQAEPKDVLPSRAEVVRRRKVQREKAKHPENALPALPNQHVQKRP